MIKLLQLSMLLLLFISCKEKQKEQSKVPDFDGISQNIKPGDNFFEHVNKQWYDIATIADDQVGVGSYMFLNIPQRELLEDILEKAALEKQTKGSIEQKLGDFYASGIDTIQINKRGFEPIKSILDAIDGVKALPELMRLVSEEQKNGHLSIVGLYISADQENSKRNIMHASQAGLGLPDRDYYFATESKTVAIQNAYKKYIRTLFELTETAHPSEKATLVYHIEK